MNRDRLAAGADLFSDVTPEWIAKNDPKHVEWGQAWELGTEHYRVRTNAGYEALLITANAMEPRAAIGAYDAGMDEHTLITTSQNPHVIRLLMGAFVLNIPEHKLRVYAPDVGGGFGSKIYHYAEEALVTLAAKKIGRPVKWTAERSESFISDAQGRDHVTHAEMAFDKDGKSIGMRVETLANMGAYLSTFAPCIPTWLHGTLLAGQYTTPAIYCNVKAVFTNTVPVDAYRGAGRPEATYLLERLVDRAARETGMDPVEIRRRNFIPNDAFPYQTPVALQYDSGDYGATLDQAMTAAAIDGFAKRKADAAKRGKRRMIVGARMAHQRATNPDRSDAVPAAPCRPPRRCGRPRPAPPGCGD